MPNETPWIEAGDWQSYEAYVGGLLSAKYPRAIIELNVKLPGSKSKTTRQVDILIKSPEVIAIDCKHYSRKVDVKCVEAFLGMLADLGIENGFIVTTKGHTRAALARAQNDDTNIVLHIVSPEKLSMFQSLGTPLIWKETLGIFLTLRAAGSPTTS